ncbi:hypothetical protein KL86DES1_20675 [uncultured Desulfovibrio sp.]|uniref:Uncharacterized protein n=1 Tax=uncultured Desulfovibrio sp. TaxID=167968 RepID=A0A212L4M7_9BACT|nr:hypothetical protein KL86DES1_20675 [uncultured Desulfovibrio sp.]VZH33577.1 conserved protein of unknown function [Desulfovibrio sp. 86]
MQEYVKRIEKNKQTNKKSNRAKEQASQSVKKTELRKNPVKRQNSAYWLHLKVRL